MPTVSEYARKRGVSHQYISKLVKKGLPLDSYEAADRWIRVNASSKAPTNPKQIARVVGEDNNGSKTHLRGEELPEHQIGKRSTTSLDSLHDALEVAVFAQEETFCLLTKAIAESTDSKIAVLFAKHNKALKIWLEADHPISRSVGGPAKRPTRRVNQAFRNPEEEAPAELRPGLNLGVAEPMPVCPGMCPSVFALPSFCSRVDHWFNSPMNFFCRRNGLLDNV